MGACHAQPASMTGKSRRQDPARDKPSSSQQAITRPRVATRRLRAPCILFTCSVWGFHDRRHGRYERRAYCSRVQFGAFTTADRATTSAVHTVHVFSSGLSRPPTGQVRAPCILFTCSVWGFHDRRQGGYERRSYRLRAPSICSRNCFTVSCFSPARRGRGPSATGRRCEADNRRCRFFYLLPGREFIIAVSSSGSGAFLDSMNTSGTTPSTWIDFPLGVKYLATVSLRPNPSPKSMML
jgi:hypothetical protein